MTPFSIVFPLFPRMTQLDFTGPLEVLTRAPGATVVLASLDGGVLEAGAGLVLSGLTPLGEIAACDLLCVPGGYGTVAMLDSPAYLNELARLGKGARYVSSVCTGSLLLGAAGLLQGKRAACHWAWRDLLGPLGAIPDDARVVRDGNVFSGGGVTAGIDLALLILAEVAGKTFAEGVQLALEYAPAPPFDSGRPESAEPAVLNAVQHRLQELSPDRTQAVKRAARRLANGALARD